MYLFYLGNHLTVFSVTISASTYDIFLWLLCFSIVQLFSLGHTHCVITFHFMITFHCADIKLILLSAILDFFKLFYLETFLGVSHILSHNTQNSSFNLFIAKRYLQIIYMMKKLMRNLDARLELTGQLKQSW